MAVHVLGQQLRRTPLTQTGCSSEVSRTWPSPLHERPSAAHSAVTRCTIYVPSMPTLGTPTRKPQPWHAKSCIAREVTNKRNH
jgi:hypothetical protein